jgi:IPT/TIG domain-containing protein
MRRHSFARVVLAGLGVSVFFTLGCSPTGPSRHFTLASLSISPDRGPGFGANVVTVSGPGAAFRSGAAITVDGNPVEATILNTNAISLVMPAHAAGKVEVTLTRAPGQAPSKVGEYTYIGPPVVAELTPSIGSTGGGTLLFVEGTGVGSAKTVTIDGVVSKFEWDWPDDVIYLTTPAHAAGPVDVIVTDEYGQSGRAIFTYASPATFDFNGDWKGWATGQPGQAELAVVLTIRDSNVIDVSCGSAPSLTLDPAPVVANGEFAFAGGGVSITGRILSPTQASGSINTVSCGSRQWRAQKQ